MTRVISFTDWRNSSQARQTRGGKRSRKGDADVDKIENFFLQIFSVMGKKL